MIFGLLCIWYASKEKIINYLFGLINVTIFAIIFFQIQLYASFCLQLFFFGANIYGWYAWRRQTKNNQDAPCIRWLSLPKALILVALGICGIIVVTLKIDRIFYWFTYIIIAIIKELGISGQIPILQPDAFPFWDSVITVLSILAMILMTRKYAENWLLWLVIDVISIVIFISQGVYMMALEYMILTIITIHGAWLWTNLAHQNYSCHSSSV
ncbi:nicotinamide mononucleotide transporter [Serratia symbiotica str. 'Cinara cedri']|nr:nicotinamide mononucleotide transporter [Serratia symbiotica str. 'Cinara cedri']